MAIDSEVDWESSLTSGDKEQLGFGVVWGKTFGFDPVENKAHILLEVVYISGSVHRFEELDVICIKDQLGL